MFKRVRVGAMAALLCLFAALPAAAEGPPSLHGDAAILIDGHTGQILYTYNAFERRYPASTTKLLTALVAVEHGTLDQIIPISEEAVDKDWDSASCYVSPGEEQPLRYLLYGLMLPSGNDCAHAIAEGVTSGDYNRFITWMNETARRIGAAQSQFSNPHGLHAPDHYTTAYDLALIGRAALANPTVRHFASTWYFDWPGKEEGGTYYSTNRLLTNYEDSVGGKTGYTEEAGFTLVHGAQRGDMYLIGVVMGVPFSTQRDQDMAALLDYGFERFSRREILTAGDRVATVSVVDGEEESVVAVAQAGFLVSTRLGTDPTLQVVPRLASEVAAPVEAGQQLGVLEIRDGDRILAEVPVLAATSVDAHLLTTAGLMQGASSILKWVIYTLAGLFLFRTVVKTTRRFLRRRRGARGMADGRGLGKTGSISLYRSSRP